MDFLDIGSDLHRLVLLPVLDDPTGGIFGPVNPNEFADRCLGRNHLNGYGTASHSVGPSLILSMPYTLLDAAEINRHQKALR